MRLLLVSSEGNWAEPLRAAFASDDVVAAPISALLQNPALAAAAEACFVAENQLSPWTVDILKQLSSITPAPLFVLTESNRSQWEEAALFAGAEQIFRRPLRPGVLQLSVSRAQRRRLGDPAPNLPLVSPPSPPPSISNSGPLAMWRDLSRVLGAAAEPDRLIREYAAKLRELIGCGRLVLYSPDSEQEGMFRCVYAAGIDASTLSSFRLGMRSGVAQMLAQRGTVVLAERLRANGRDAAAQRELAVFGAEVAVPIMGGSGLVGILLLGSRVAGGEYSEPELAAIYHALEAIAPHLRSARDAEDDHLDGQALLCAFPIAAALVSDKLTIPHANLAFRQLIGRPDVDVITLEELPSDWARAVSAAVQTHATSARVELEHRSIGTPRKVRLSVRRLNTKATAALSLVTVEDIVPPIGQDADPHGIANLLQRVGEQLSNEFRNAITPVDIMVQLSHEPTTTRGELEQLSTQVGTAIHRLRRRIDDLAYLTKRAIIPEQTIVSSVLRLTRERLEEWVGHKQLKRVVWLNEFSATELTADSRALAVALAELVMNALEACEGKQVTVTAENTGDLVSFRVRNSGVWAPPAESSGFRHRPFVSSKSMGVGLGIEVATRVAENHGGKLIVGPTGSDVVEAIVRVPCSIRPHATARLEPGAVQVN